MACDLTSGYNWAGCDGGPGGIKEIGLCELNWKSGSGSSALTVSGGVITAWTLATGKVFRKYIIRPDNSFYTDNATKNPTTGGYNYDPTVQMMLATMSTTTRQEALLILQNNLMVITRDNQNVYRLAGYNFGLQATAITAAGGTLIADAPQQVFTLTGKDTIPMYEVNSSLIATLMP